jgi:hypothetical protein
VILKASSSAYSRREYPDKLEVSYDLLVASCSRRCKTDPGRRLTTDPPGVGYSAAEDLMLVAKESVVDLTFQMEILILRAEEMLLIGSLVSFHDLLVTHSFESAVRYPSHEIARIFAKCPAYQPLCRCEFTSGF